MAYDPRWDNEIPDKDKDIDEDIEEDIEEDIDEDIEEDIDEDIDNLDDRIDPDPLGRSVCLGGTHGISELDDKTVYQDVDPDLFWQLVDLIGEYPRSILVNHPLFHIMNEYFDPTDTKTITFFQLPTGTTIEVENVTELFESVFDFCHNVLPNSEYCRRMDLAMTMMKSWCDADETSSQLMNRLTI